MFEALTGKALLASRIAELSATNMRSEKEATKMLQTILDRCTNAGWTATRRTTFQALDVFAADSKNPIALRARAIRRQTQETGCGLRGEDLDIVEQFMDGIASDRQSQYDND